MRDSRFLMGAVLSVVMAAVCGAQTISDGGQWNALFLKGDLNLGDTDRLKWWFDGHYRLFDDLGGFGQSIVRPAVGWQLPDAAGTLWAGWAWIRTSPGAGEDIDEQRFFQQWTWSTQDDDWKYGLRTRFEERLAEGGDDTAFRLRQFVSARYRLPVEKWRTFVLWDEAFFNFNDADWGPRSGFDQNRLFVGMGFKRNPNQKHRTEIGYLNQTINTASGGTVVNHILSVNRFH